MFDLIPYALTGLEAMLVIPLCLRLALTHSRGTVKHP
jgi:hypothetical protein